MSRIQSSEDGIWHESDVELLVEINKTDLDPCLCIDEQRLSHIR
jgi:hypothetical protein